MNHATAQKERVGTESLPAAREAGTATGAGKLARASEMMRHRLENARAPLLVGYDLAKRIEILARHSAAHGGDHELRSFRRLAQERHQVRVHLLGRAEQIPLRNTQHLSHLHDARPRDLVLAAGLDLAEEGG